MGRWRTQGPTAPGSERSLVDRAGLVDLGHLRPVVAVSVVTRAGGSVFEGVFDLVACLFGVALELIDASLGAQAGVAGGAAEVLLGGALGGFGLVRELLTDAYCGFLRCRWLGLGA